MLDNISILTDKLKDLESLNLDRNFVAYQHLPNQEVIDDNKKYLSFCSNDYLGLSFNDQMAKSSLAAIKKYGSGALSSRYIIGNHPLYSKLEAKISKITKKDQSIVFGSGYLANIGVISSLFDKNDLILADKLSHSCLIEGSKLSGAKFIRFPHNDLKSLSNLIAKYRKQYNKCLIISETVFSMDGDLAPIDQLINIAKDSNSFILTDDAHGLGVINAKYTNYDLHLKIGTLSKAVAGYGGYVAAKSEIINYLRNFAKSAIYSTALPPAILASNLMALEEMSKGNLTQKLWQNIDYFCDLLNIKNQKSAIIPIIVGDAAKALEISNNLKKSGFLISAIRPPTVAIGKSRLRITISAAHKKKDLKNLAQIIKNFVI